MKPIKQCFCLLCAAFVLSPAFAKSDSEKNTALTVENRDVLETNNPTNPRDPWESFNRKMFAVHTVLYENIGKPVGTVYDKAVPLPVHSSLNNAFGNSSDLWSGANHLLQGKASHAGSDVLRFLINSTLGILGIFDVASEMAFTKTMPILDKLLPNGACPMAIICLFRQLAPNTRAMLWVGRWIPTRCGGFCRPFARAMWQWEWMFWK